MSGWHPSARGSRKWPDRFWRRVEKTDTCWLWTGSTRSTAGYGQVFHEGQQKLTSRVSWELANGPVPDGMYVLHCCDNPPCVRPDHLFLGTIRDNTQDMIAKGRARYQKPEYVEKRARRSQKPKHVVPLHHGSYTRYQNGCRCDVCVEGRREYNREAQRRSRTRRAA